MTTNFLSIKPRFFYSIIFSGILFGFCYLLNLPNYFFDFLSKQTLNYFEPSKDIVLILIDENAIDKYGDSSNWTIARYNNLLQIIESEKPKAVVLDYYFNSKTFPENVDWELINSISGDNLSKTKNIFNKYQKNITSKNYISSIDIEFSKTLKKYNNVFLPYLINDLTGEIETKPITLFTRGTFIGYSNVKVDKDGKIRKFYNLEESEHIGEIIRNKYFSKEKINKNDKLIRFTTNGDSISYSYIPYTNIYKKVFEDYDSNKISLKDKIVIVGDYGSIFGDFHYTSVGTMPGMEIIANQIQNFIENSFISHISLYYNLLIFLLLFTIYFFIFQYIKSKKISSFLYILSLIGIYFISFKLFLIGYFVDFFLLFSAISSSFIIINFFSFLADYYERKNLKKFFSRFVGKNLVDKIISNPKLNLKGEKREMTVFFCDIEGFTSLSEKLNPEKILEILNKMFEVGNNIIFKNEGTLDKYIGDAIMAFWGAPGDDNKHTYNACKSSLEIRDGLEEFNKTLTKDSLPEINVRIGISTGIMTVGAVGTDEYSDYTVIGDDVNLASRLESINRIYKTQILLSQSSYFEIKDKFIVREIDTINVKGKENKVTIYELLDYQDISKQKKQYYEQIILNHKKGLDLYKNRNFKEARKYFEKNFLNKDKVAEIFLQRIDNFIKNSPDKTWDGTWIFIDK